MAARHGLLFNGSKDLHSDAKFMLVQRVYEMERICVQYSKDEQA